MTRSSAVIAAAASQAEGTCGSAAGTAATWSRIRTGSPPVACATQPYLLPGRRAAEHLPQPAADRLLGQRPEQQPDGVGARRRSRRPSTCRPWPSPSRAEERDAHGGVAQAGEEQAEQFPPARGEPVGVVKRHDQPAARGDVPREHGRAPARSRRTAPAAPGPGRAARPPAARRDEVQQRAALPEGQPRRRPVPARRRCPGRRPATAARRVPARAAGRRGAAALMRTTGTPAVTAEAANSSASLVFPRPLAPRDRQGRRAPGAHRPEQPAGTRRARPPGRRARAGCR